MSNHAEKPREMFRRGWRCSPARPKRQL